jgi:biotin carboxyl carrier protein
MQAREDAPMSTEIKAPMPGKIVEVMVGEGDEVVEYQEVITLEAMKMENPLPTPVAGRVKQITVAVGDQVSNDQVLMIVE